MRSTTYGRPVSGHASNPLEWFPSGSPSPHLLLRHAPTSGSVSRSLSEGGCFLVDDSLTSSQTSHRARSLLPAGHKVPKIFSLTVAPEGRVSPLGGLVPGRATFTPLSFEWLWYMCPWVLDCLWRNPLFTQGGVGRFCLFINLGGRAFVITSSPFPSGSFLGWTPQLGRPTGRRSGERHVVLARDRGKASSCSSVPFFLRGESDASPFSLQGSPCRLGSITLYWIFVVGPSVFPPLGVPGEL